MTRGRTRVVKWVWRAGAEVIEEGEPSRREMTVMRGEAVEVEVVEGGWRAIKAIKGREK